MRERYDMELQQLRNDLSEMGVMCKDIVSTVLNCLKNYDSSKTQEINSALSDISSFERTIESTCMRLIMRQQPIAKDLRNIRSAMFIIYDMERIGIQSEEIAEMLSYVSSHPQKVDQKIFELGDAAVKMTNDSIEAFEKQDKDAALAVVAYDDSVDDLFDASKKALIVAIQTDDKETDAESCVDMLMIAKYFERIADHAESIARWVYFSITGEHLAQEEK